MRKLFPLLALIALAGCSTKVSKNPDPVEVSGKVSLQGKSVHDVTLTFLTVSESGAQANFPVLNGEFKGQMYPGKYTYYFSEGKNPAVLDSIPTKYRIGAMDRQIDIKGGDALVLSLE